MGRLWIEHEFIEAGKVAKSPPSTYSKVLGKLFVKHQTHVCLQVQTSFIPPSGTILGVTARYQKPEHQLEPVVRYV